MGIEENVILKNQAKRIETEAEIDCMGHEHGEGSHMQDYIVIVSSSFLLSGYWSC